MKTSLRILSRIYSSRASPQRLKDRKLLRPKGLCLQPRHLNVDRFLLPALQIEMIINETTIGDMRDSLAIIPYDLHQVFEQMNASIEAQPEGRKRLTMNTLMWISHAKASLTTRDLRKNLAIRSGTTFLDSTYRPTDKKIVDRCLGLVDIDPKTSHV